MADLFVQQQETDITSPSRASKVTVVGVGQVGMACAFSLLSRQVVSQIVLADIDKAKLEGEVKDLQHAGAFLHANVIQAGPNYEGTENSDVCVITAGVRQRPDESRRSLLARNVAVFKSIIPPLVKLSPNTIFLIVSNPCDTLTYITWKLSGLPKSRVIGSGTYLDSSRFRVLVAERLGVSAMSIHGFILGEHGDSSVPIWSGLNVSGVPLHLTPKRVEEEGWQELHEKVKNSALDVIKLKGYTNWAIGCSVSQIVDFILKDTKRVLPLSVDVNGFYGVDKDVFLSLPCVLGRQGITQILRAPFDETEAQKFKESATQMRELLETLEELK